MTTRYDTIGPMITDIGPQPSIPSDREKPDFTIIGAGVMGILTAGQLVSEGHSVEIISEGGKPDINAQLSSTAAYAQFLPWLEKDQFENVLAGTSLGEIVDKGRSYYDVLAQNPHETGVMGVENVELATAASPWPDGLPGAMGAHEKTLTKPVRFIDPSGEEINLDTEYKFDTYSINARKTLSFLADELEKLGVKFRQGRLTANQLHTLEGVIINAAGSGAAEFDPSKEVKFFKGHTIVLRPKEGYRIPTQVLSVDDLEIMPREDGTIIIGGLSLQNPTTLLPQGDEFEELRARVGFLAKHAAHLVDGLDPDLFDHFDVILHQAGFRTELKGDGGIRVAPDEANERLVHAYGFSGVGWSVGPHYSAKIAKMAKEVHNKKIRS